MPDLETLNSKLSGVQEYRMRMSPKAIYIFVTFFLLLPGTTSAQHAGHGMGKVSFSVSCSPAAQTEFNRAVALLHHMTYPQARAAFERVGKLDARCAMAHWGVAMTLFQPLWPTRPSPEALQKGWQEVEQANSLQTVTQRER